MAINFSGTNGNDVIFGSSDNDTLRGLDGDDKLFGGNGDDFIDGGFGFDTIDGGAGTDTTSYAFFSGPIDANLSTGVVRFPGNSPLTDTLVSIENLIGTAGNDTIVGNDANNVLSGGAGNDFIDGGFGFDTIDGGAGTDTTSYAFFSGPIDANLSTGVVRFPGNSPLTDTLVGIENLIGTAGNDTIVGNDANNVLSGGAGNDFIDGGFGFDTIDGGAGTDTTSYAFFSGPIDANLSTGVVRFPGNSPLTDTLVSIENLIGTAGNDTIVGNDANNVLSGGAGNDFIDGGFGFDTIDGGAGTDTTSYAFFSGPIDANLSTGVVRFPGNSPLTDTLVSIENLIGTAGNDTIVGNDANNVLSGGAGNDFIDGGFGFDTIDGGAGTDTTSYAFFSGPIDANLSTGVVRFPGNSPLTDTLVSIENLIGTAGNDTIVGNDANNVLSGGAGNDFIVGGYGSDVLTGGAGADKFVFNSKFEGIDIIKDFEWREGDKIQISKSAFGASSNSQFSYNSTNGSLFFAGDQFATIENKPSGFSVNLDVVLV
ncbi:calcium-binding protein [Nostoc sp. DSM 114160]|jgi:Ca2+-binding RTX toxin-like protein